MNSSNHNHHGFMLILQRLVIVTALASAALLITSVTAQMQNKFDSGSTGMDKEFNAPPTPAVQEVQVPEPKSDFPNYGVFNYTTYNIPAGVTIKYKPNSRNTPLIILTQGDVTIGGKIDISGGNGSAAVFGAPSPNGGGLGGVGGFNGGRGGFSFDPFLSGVAGDGPGGGSPGAIGLGICASSGGFGGPGANGGSSAAGGQKYGSRTLIPLIGGSGGGGGNGSNGISGGGGGGGGGAILIASSGAINFGAGQTRGEILASGGNGIQTGSSVGGNGSGGAIRLAANTISGRAGLNVAGGSNGCGNNFSGHGYIRIEAFNYNGFEPQTSPTVTADTPPQPIISLAMPTTVNPPNAPQLMITSVGGKTAPPDTKGSFGAPPDILLPPGQANPINVALKAANIPISTLVKVTVIPEAGARASVDSSPLAGAPDMSTAMANVNLPMTGTSVITATVTFDLPKVARAAPMLIDGERVRRIEVAAAFGGKSAVTYITESGKRISREAE